MAEANYFKSKNGEYQEYRPIDRCVDKLLETLKNELPEESRTYEIYKYCLEEASQRIESTPFKEL